VRRLAKLAVAVTIAAPGFSQTISDADISHWQRAAGDRTQALNFLIGAAWIRGEATQRGIAVSDAEAREAIDEKPHDGLTRADLAYQARITLLDARIRDQIAQPAAQSVTPQQIEAYVQAHPRTQPEQRTTRLVLAPSRAKAKAALRAIRNKLTWRSAARRYESEGNGAPETIEPGMLPLRVERAVFNASENETTRYGTYVFKVTAITPTRPLPLEQQRATAWEILSSDAQNRAITAFTSEFRSRWRLRTTCAPPYATHPNCSNPPTVE
jgi:foldase protein PrsA